MILVATPAHFVHITDIMFCVCLLDYHVPRIYHVASQWGSQKPRVFGSQREKIV